MSTQQQQHSNLTIFLVEPHTKPKTRNDLGEAPALKIATPLENLLTSRVQSTLGIKKPRNDDVKPRELVSPIKKTRAYTRSMRKNTRPLYRPILLHPYGNKRILVHKKDLKKHLKK